MMMATDTGVGMAQHWADRFTEMAGQVPLHLGTRYDAGGRFLPEHGNTVVAQVVPGSETEAALVDLRAAMQALPFAPLFAFTAMPSYHMTVFEGIIETRRQTSHWPVGLDPHQPVAEATVAMAARLAGFTAPPAFAMRVVEVTPFGLHLTGANEQDEVHVRAWRDGLAAALGLRVPGHDEYGFHTTMAYALEWPPVEAVAVYRAALQDLTAAFQARVPVMHLARPAFCTFADMNAFPPVLAL
jgi:hypothetical protein